MAGKGRLRAAQSRWGNAPLGRRSGRKASAMPKPHCHGWACCEPGGAGRGRRWPQPSAGEVPWLKSAWGARGHATMKGQREAVSGQPAAMLPAWWASVLRRCCGRWAWFGLAWVVVSRGRQAGWPNTACSGRGYAPGRPARQKSGKILACGDVGRLAPPLTPSLAP